MAVGPDQIVIAPATYTSCFRLTFVRGSLWITRFSGTCWSERVKQHSTHKQAASHLMSWMQACKITCRAFHRGYSQVTGVRQTSINDQQDN